MSSKILAALVFAVFVSCLLPLRANAGCARPVAGSIVTEPGSLYSQDGELIVELNYETSTDADGRSLYCFKTADHIESPTLHVSPGDTLKITVHNKLPKAQTSSSMMMSSSVCGASTMNSSSVNMHFHGANVSPRCHSDEVINTTINSGQMFVYTIKFPSDEPPGLYWYHPHIHGISEAAVQGGASGAIVVDGLENLQPSVIGLPTRIMLIRDQVVAGNATPGGAVPAWDISLNYVPIAYPALLPAIVETRTGRREFWRVVNASADTVADIAIKFDGVSQPLEVVALDGVAVDSQDGTRRGRIITDRHILLPPAGRAEFTFQGPSEHVHRAIFETAKVDTGPDGDNDTTRVLAVLTTGHSGADSLPTMPAAARTPDHQRFEGLSEAPVSVRRKLYFSEVLSDPSDAASPTNFFITVDGAKPALFAANNPPAITTTQGFAEEWTIENRAEEAHEFHMHQIHFKLLQRNGESLPADQQQFLDTVQVPSWSGKGPYPSVTLKMDFRGDITGDFVYHCHILGHEDSGMMAILRVLPRH